MIYRHELSQRQLRALLLLLVLLPLSPTVLMFRFMVEAIRNENAAADERLGDIYRQALASATASLESHLKARDAIRNTKAGDVFDYYRRSLDLAVKIRIVGADGSVLAGDAVAVAKPITEQPLGWMIPGASVRLFFAENSSAVLMDEQINTYGWVVAAVAVVNVLISAAAAVALYRQSQLGELRSSALATVAHELKTPLASMRVLTETLLLKESLDEKTSREYLRLIGSENDRLIRLSENFLTLSRFETQTAGSRRAAVEPALLVETVLQSVDSRFKEAGIHLQTNLAEGLPTVSVDCDDMVVALANLLENALKYSDSGKPVIFRVQSAGTLVHFIVEDHGIGIPKEAQPHIFERFFQADRKLTRGREGCGLGLYIAHSIVEAYGGTITVQSAVGLGSTFRVALPATYQS